MLSTGCGKSVRGRASLGRFAILCAGLGLAALGAGRAEAQPFAYVGTPGDSISALEVIDTSTNTVGTPILVGGGSPTGSPSPRTGNTSMSRVTRFWAPAMLT